MLSLPSSANPDASLATTLGVHVHPATREKRISLPPNLPFALAPHLPAQPGDGSRAQPKLKGTPRTPPTEVPPGVPPLEGATADPTAGTSGRVSTPLVR